MADLDVLAPQIRPYAPNTGENIIDQYTRRAARQFCVDSRVWLVDLGGIEIQQDVRENDDLLVHIDSFGTPELDDEYQYILPENAAILDIDRVQLGDVDVMPSAYWFDRVTDLMHVMGPATRTAETLTTRVSLQPTADTRVLPDFLIRDHAEAITAYVIYELASMPGETFTNGRVAEQQMLTYRLRLAESRVQKARRSGSGTIYTTPPPFV